MPRDEPIFEALQGGQKPIFDEDVKAKRARTHQTHQEREALNRPGVFPESSTWRQSLQGSLDDEQTEATRKMLTFHNISQHFREIDARLRRIPW